jgi:hypothetical protein
MKKIPSFSPEAKAERARLRAEIDARDEARKAEARVADFFAAQERSNKARAELGIDS